MQTRCALFCLALAACAPPHNGIGIVEEGLGAACPVGTTTLGIDVSHYDGTITWSSVKGGNYQFAYMKCTEGTTFFDPTFTTNWTNSGTAGVIHGAYHFFHPMDDPVAQADYMVQKCGIPQAGDLPLALDLEVTDGQSGATVKQTTEAFLQEIVNKTGTMPIVYTSASFINGLGAGNAPNIGGYPLWVAHWNPPSGCPSLPPEWTDWTIWQSSSTGTVPGIMGMNNVDIDQFNGTLSDLQSFVSPQSTTPDLAGSTTNGDMATSNSSDMSQSTGADMSARSDGGMQKPPLGHAAGCGCELATSQRFPRELLSIIIALFIVTRRRWSGSCRV